MTSGIYEILNTTSNERYIGSAIDFRKRRQDHFCRLRKGDHRNRHLQHAWNKHGDTAFEFKKLLICAPKDLIFYEQRAIDGYKPEYNIAPKAGSTLGRLCSAETKAKISAANTGNTYTRGYKHSAETVAKNSAARKGKTLTATHRANIAAAAVGKKHSDEWKANIAAGRRGKTHSPETREKIRAALRRRKENAVEHFLN